MADFAHLLGASLPRCDSEGCEHSSIYPEGFSFCPACGRPLSAWPGAAAPPDWWGPHADQLLPRHVPHGLPVTSLPLGDSLEERPAAPSVGRFDAAMPPPPNAECVFIAAGYGFQEQRLLALAPGRGVLQYWDPLGELWHVLVPEEGAASLKFDASDYGWLPALEPRRGEVGLVPTAQGLYRLWINPINETFRLEAVLAAPLAAAPGAMRRQLACLVRGQCRRAGAVHAGCLSWRRGRNTNAARCRCPAGRGRSATTASWPGCTTKASCCGARARRRASCPGPTPGCRACSLAARP
jgi:hypothetical protein